MFSSKHCINGRYSKQLIILQARSASGLLTFLARKVPSPLSFETSSLGWPQKSLYTLHLLSASVTGMHHHAGFYAMQDFVHIRQTVHQASYFPQSQDLPSLGFFSCHPHLVVESH